MPTARRNTLVSYPPPPGQNPNNPYGQPQQPPQQPYGYPQQPQQPQAGQPGYGYPQQAPNPYGQQQVPGQQGYGYPQQPQAGAYGYNPAGAPTLASWISRVGAVLIDGLIIGIPMMILSAIGGSMATIEDPSAGIVFIILGYIVAFGLGLWFIYQEGTTGQTIGKKAVGIRLLRQDNGQPLGFGMAFVRKLAHILDSFACYIGYLWPLWDDKNQTFADKVCSTLVIKA
jgi:uncharacterized RDD family membrane protein YckC